MKLIKNILKITIFTMLILLLSIFLIDKIVKDFSSNKQYNYTNSIPYNKVGLLLGTAKYLQGGWINLYYKYRIEATVELFNSNKIDYILVSGDNSRKDYDEPSTMKNDLIKKGIPSDKIFLDYAGFRTLDSVIRSKEIFGQNSITVISQQFHNERAIFIAKNKNIEAIGFNAKDVHINYGFKVQLREKLARIKMMLDLIFDKKPKFLGEEIIKITEL